MLIVIEYGSNSFITRIEFLLDCTIPVFEGHSIFIRLSTVSNDTMFKSDNVIEPVS